MPTSGTGPYTLDIVFSEKDLIDNVNFMFRLLVSTATGSCPTPGGGSVSNLSDGLFTNNTVVKQDDVIAGQCVGYTAQIVDAQNVIVSSSFVTIDNV